MSSGLLFMSVFVFQQNTLYEMLISGWSSDVCFCRSLDLVLVGVEIRETEDSEAGRVLVELGDDQIIILALLDIERGTAQGCAEIGRASCRERVCAYV